jgi:hypothetical protein
MAVRQTTELTITRVRPAVVVLAARAGVPHKAQTKEPAGPEKLRPLQARRSFTLVVAVAMAAAAAWVVVVAPVVMAPTDLVVVVADPVAILAVDAAVRVWLSCVISADQPVQAAPSHQAQARPLVTRYTHFCHQAL